MQGTSASERHRSAQIQGFKGLLTNLADRRAVPVGPSFGYERIPTGFCSVAQDVVFDEAGNPRPRDGYSPWWPALPQRLQLADMQPGEVTWTKTGVGTLTDDVVIFFNGVQSKSLVVTAGNNATATRTYAANPAPMNVLKENFNGYTTGIWAALRIVGLAHAQVDLIMVTSLGTVTFSHVEAGNADSVWKSTNFGFYNFSAGETVTSIAFKVTATGGQVTLNFGDAYLAVLNQGSAVPGAFTEPTGICLDAAGNIYVTDQDNNRVEKFDSSGNFLSQFGSAGTGNGQLRVPYGIALDAAGNIYVGDTGNHRIQKFTPSGLYLAQFGNSGPGTLSSPGFITIDPAGNIYVADEGANQVVKFDATLAWVANFNGGAPFTFDGPTGIALDGAGNMYVTDGGNSNVRKLSPAGATLQVIGSPGGTDGHFIVPVGIALDAAGNIYVVDFGNHRVQKFDPTGVFVSKFGSIGSTNGQFGGANGIAVDGAGNIYVADTANDRVQIFTAGLVWSKTIGLAVYAQDSFCTGAYEFRPLASPSRYLLGAFGETLYFDVNEARAPSKIISGLTRNTPLYFSDDQAKVYFCNGIDPNMLWTGSSYRTVGFPAPDATGIGLAASAGAGLTAGAYFYAVSFVYGEGATLHGESSISVVAGSVAVAGGNLRVTVSNLPVGAVGSGVVQRRVYRVTVNAPNTATFNLVQVINDNVTNTFIDSMPDVILLEQAEGSIDNGIPPVAKYMKFFGIGMVYMKGNQVFYSRPGVDLSSTPETVPALNSFNVSPAGQITGCLVFNNTLYIYQEYGLGAAQWVGTKLTYRPVLHSVQANIGCIDQNSIAVKGNDLVYWRDQKGQLQKMDINENISLASGNIKNLCNNFNNNLTSNLSFFESFAGKAKLSNGTVGSNLNLNLDGSLSYQYQALGGVVLGPQQVALAGHVPGGNDSTGPTNFSSHSTFQAIVTAQKPVAVSKIGIQLLSRFLENLNMSLTVRVYKQNVRGSYDAGPLLAQGVLAFTINAQTTAFPLVPLDNTVYIPNGESVIVQVVGDSDSVFVYSGGLQSGKFVVTVAKGTNFALCYRFDYQDVLLTTVKSAILDAGVTLQRWAGAQVQSPLLAGGASIQVNLDTDSVNPFAAASANNYHATPPPLYYLLAIGDNFPNSEPLYNSNPNGYLYPLRDYRLADNNTTQGWTDVFPLPAPNPQQRYAQITVTLDPNRVSTPPNAANSRVSTNITTSFPSIAGVAITGSTEAAFPNPYAPTSYARDIYTSEIITTSGAVLLGSFGNFNVVYAQNQQRLTFQIRTGSSSGAIVANPWVTVTPNAQVPIAAMNNPATDVCFQYRIIFQDDPSQQGSVANQGQGQPSVVYSVAISWFGSSNPAFIIPAMPPSLAFHKDRIVGSWASLHSSLLDTTLCMDWYEDQVGKEHERFSTWTGLHFGVFATSNGKMIGGPMSGGQLVRMFNSDIGDLATVWPNAYMGVPGVIATIPHNFGSSNIKSVSGVYVGCELNVFARGYVQGPLNSYSVATDNQGNSATPSFSFSISTNPAGNGLLNAVTPGALADMTMSQTFQTLLSHASLQPANASGQFKPYENEYFIDVSEQERAFVLAVSLVPYKDPNGNSVFPSLTGFGVEYFLENYRGV